MPIAIITPVTRTSGSRLVRAAFLCALPAHEVIARQDRVGMHLPLTGERTEAPKGNLPQIPQLKVPDVRLEGTSPSGVLAFVI